jgi:hypothetical protein
MVGCYDRLVNNLILIVLDKLGLPPTVSKCLGLIWEEAIHLIKTIYDTSDVTHGNLLEMPCMARDKALPVGHYSGCCVIG